MKQLQRKLLASVAAMLLCLPATADEVETLHIWMADGTETTVQLYTRPQVTFDGTVVRISSPVQTLEFPSADVLRFTYSGVDTSTAIDGIEKTADYRNDGDNLYFNGNVTVDKIQIYTADGKSVPLHIHTVGSQLCLPLSDIPTGIYLLNVNGRTYKLIRK